MEGLFAYPCRRVATPAYPLGAKIRKNRPRCSPTGGFLCSFNTITPKSPHSKPFPIPFASVLGVTGFYDFGAIHVDNITKPCIKGMFTETPSTYGLPASRGNYIVITLYSTPSNPDTMGVQLCYNTNGATLTRFIRSKDSGMSWSAWTQL